MDKYKTILHDIMNRDTAILYINGEFLESATHGVCLRKYIINNNNNKLNIKSFNLQKRPDHEIFIELSINIGPIVIGHKVDKEKSIYITYGIINGIAVEFNKINNNILNDFKNKYNMDLKDDLAYIEDKNLYQNDSKKIVENLYKDIFKITNNDKYIDEMINENYILTNDEAFYKNGVMIIPNTDTLKFDIYTIGNKIMSCNPKEWKKTIKLCDLKLTEYLLSINAKIECACEEADFKITINNPYELIYHLEAVEDGIDIMSAEFEDGFNAIDLLKYGKIKTINLQLEDIKLLYNYNS